MSGSFSDFKLLRSQLKETEARLKGHMPASSPRPVKSPSDPKSYLRLIQQEAEELDQELARIEPMKEPMMKLEHSFEEGVSLHNEGKKHLEMIRRDMAKLDKELGNKLSSSAEDDDLCISSPSDPEDLVNMSPFHSRSNSLTAPRKPKPYAKEAELAGQQLSKDADRKGLSLAKDSEWREKDPKPDKSTPSNPTEDRVKSLERRLQGANASVRALEKALKDKDYKIKELEEELQFKNKTLDNYHSQSSAISSYQKSVLTQSSLTSQMRKKEKDLEK